MVDIYREKEEFKPVVIKLETQEEVDEIHEILKPLLSTPFNHKIYDALHKYR